MNFEECPFGSIQDITSGFITDVINQIDTGLINKKNLIWLELNGCSGNIISLLDGQNPGFSYFVNNMVNYIFDNSLNSSAGQFAMENLFNSQPGDYILAVEGAVSLTENGTFNIIGSMNERAITGLEAVQYLGERAEYVIAVGDCASYGGVSSARPNPSGGVGVQSVLNRKVINLTGCPCHPEWFLVTLAHILRYGEPILDERNRPLMLYGVTIHDRCNRRSYFDNGIFAQTLGEETCMFNLGCRGPVTQIDCPIRRWNGHVNWPVDADSVCIGCAQFGFPDEMEPFITYDIT